MTRFVTWMAACLLMAGSAFAQDERGSIIIEAEIIQSNDATSLALVDSTQIAASLDSTSTLLGAVIPELNSDSTIAIVQGLAGVDSTGIIRPLDPSVEQVAATLINSASTGSITLADTTMVQALAAGRRNKPQNLSALVTITVVDPDGTVRTQSSTLNNLPMDMFGRQVNGVGSLLQQTNQPGQASVLSGDSMNRSTGITYFYVQICTCSL